MRSVQRNILLTPGPATTTDTVKFAQIVPDICPREPEFGQLMESISTDLTAIVADEKQYTAVLFGGSGTAAMDAVLSSVIGEDTIIIINNGAYGQRMCEIATVYGLHFIEFVSPPDKPVDLSALEQILKLTHTPITHLTVVHHETTTGLLNNINAIGELCKTYQVELIVDAISSFGAVPIQMEDMNISYLIASSNKNVQGLPGVSFVIAPRQKFEGLQHVRQRSYYLNLYDQYKYFLKHNQMRFTAPIQTLYALRQAINEFMLEGIEQRYSRYTQSWESLTQGIHRLGLNHIVAEEHHSKLLTSIIEPICEGYDFQQMHDFFYTKGFTIYPGKVEKLNTFRIANIGDITHHDIDAFLVLLEIYLRDIGFPLREAVITYESKQK
ncbi:2-aminoethylphosphonate aminotransferase [Paenibacillus macquariensis]|uniref:2-aminoethylphosphonate--pyruvate transaminase n=1 Tax=Paenibacillus macquariensis TaxID=948756 RepID=A0ABY1JZC2_9BACL|nr:2-aminoethylphosphonate--pyruvate transaminase [Paenibacillus macquariensis]MEC0091278.1 2-aminoethylphosphonate--pyruvate transaminase [Paenibacillus macquariensis]OAB37971.1 septum site-determining protein [Paenibacillus macquariensis subsp. macquariensis]SIR03433.1 2-aminoethylphosphonate-pyruvate transaminase [Paenibacillus macquariensis]